MTSVYGSMQLSQGHVIPTFETLIDGPAAKDEEEHESAEQSCQDDRVSPLSFTAVGTAQGGPDDK